MAQARAGALDLAPEQRNPRMIPHTPGLGVMRAGVLAKSVESLAKAAVGDIVIVIQHNLPKPGIETRSTQ